MGLGNDYGWVFDALARGRHQHTFDVLTTVDGEPSGIVCTTCGHTWPVDEDRYLACREATDGR